MTSRGITRNANILIQLGESHNSQPIDVYSPGWLNYADIVATARYSGYITSLRLTIEISSIPELITITTDELANQEEIDTAKKETFNYNKKKCLRVLMQTSLTPIIKIADLYLFNKQPFYYLNLLPYFTDAATFDIAPDATIYAQMVDVGDGLLMGDDRILILGTVVEESPYPDTYLMGE